MPAGYTKIGVFSDHNELALVRSRLEAEGIETLTENEHVSALRIPLFSGNVRLYVRDAEAPLAEALLDVEVSEDGDEGLWNESLEAGAENAFDLPPCPECGSDNVTPSFSLASVLAFPLYVLGISLARHDRKHWRCHHCQRKWME